MRYRCEPCEHRWWEHRSPDPNERLVGIMLMMVGGFLAGIGALQILGVV